MIELKKTEFFETGKDGVKKILTPDDRKIDIIEFEDKTLCYVKSELGYPAIYPLRETRFEPKAEAILMDLDGTSVHSEEFWMWLISVRLFLLSFSAMVIMKKRFLIEIITLFQ